MDINKKTEELVRAIRKTSQFKEYMKAKKEFEENKEARMLLNDFQKAKSELAILIEGNFSGIEDQRKKVDKLSNKVLNNKTIGNYVKSKENYRELVEKLALVIGKGIEFPINTPKKKSCCGR